MKAKIKTTLHETMWVLGVLAPHPSPRQAATSKVNYLKCLKSIGHRISTPTLAVNILKGLLGPKDSKRIWSNVKIPSQFWNVTVAQSRLTLRDPMDYSPPGSPVHGILQGNLPNPGIKPGSPALQADSLPYDSLGKSPWNVLKCT